MNSPKRLAGIAGLLYLVVAIYGGFAQGFVYPKVYAAGDAATTAKHLLANSGLVRIGVVADLIPGRRAGRSAVGEAAPRRTGVRPRRAGAPGGAAVGDPCPGGHRVVVLCCNGVRVPA